MSDPGVTLNQRIDLFFTERGQGLNPTMLKRRRLLDICRLDAMSDADLRRVGLRRDEILAHVFRDLLVS
ncbi:hypothetical protein [Litorisediminicola beolgyonensis]|uniref:DUF1127 domain-containing protein n=1 Tax=Litorisediminicola beolgyonensis TaxID=1173614 RepID=A0ABW3ZLT3_9RHOB